MRTMPSPSAMRKSHRLPPAYCRTGCQGKGRRSAVFHSWSSKCRNCGLAITFLLISKRNIALVEIVFRQIARGAGFQIGLHAVHQSRQIERRDARLMINLANHRVVILLELMGDHFVDQQAFARGQAGFVAGVERMFVVVLARNAYDSLAERDAKIAPARTAPLPNRLPRQRAALRGFPPLLKEMHEVWLGHNFISFLKLSQILW